MFNLARLLIAAASPAALSMHMPSIAPTHGPAPVPKRRKYRKNRRASSASYCSTPSRSKYTPSLCPHTRENERRRRQMEKRRAKLALAQAA